MQSQLQLSSSQFAALKKSVYTHVKHSYVKKRNGQKAFEINYHQLFFRQLVWWQKLLSLADYLFLRTAVAEYEVFVFQLENQSFVVKKYPYLNYILEINAEAAVVKKLCRRLKINENPALAHSALFHEKIASQQHHRRVRLFVLDRLIQRHNWLRWLVNWLHHGVADEDFFMFVNFEINWFCNRRCSYCPVSKFKRVTQQKLPLSTFLKVIKELHERNYDGYLHYNFYNETLLDRRLEHFLRLAKKYCPNAQNHINTNGDLLTPEKYQRLVAAGADFIFMTIHDGTLSEQRTKLLSTTKAMANRIDYELPSNMVFNNRGGLVDVGPKVSPQPQPCFIPAYDVEITAKGDVLPCCNDYHEKMKMGNVVDQSLLDIWYGKRYAKFRHDLKRGYRSSYALCRHCNF